MEMTASGAPLPPPCDSEVFESGTPVFISAEIPSEIFEVWVKSVADESGQRVDWHYVGGRAVVKALGDLDKVGEAIGMLLPEHDRLQRESLSEYDPYPYQPCRRFLLWDTTTPADPAGATGGRRGWGMTDEELSELEHSHDMISPAEFAVRKALVAEVRRLKALVAELEAALHAAKWRAGE
jgi:hypothetical protein